MTNFPETGSTSGVHLETFTIYIYIYIRCKYPYLDANFAGCWLVAK